MSKELTSKITRIAKTVLAHEDIDYIKEISRQMMLSIVSVLEMSEKGLDLEQKICLSHSAQCGLNNFEDVSMDGQKTIEGARLKKLLDMLYHKQVTSVRDALDIKEMLRRLVNSPVYPKR